jgi:phosphocarrier protein HPr
MYSKTVVVVNKKGLHARPASDFVTKAQGYKSTVTIRKTEADNGQQIDAKSIMQVLAAGITAGTEIEVSAEGEDAREAVEDLVELLANNLD